MHLLLPLHYVLAKIHLHRHSNWCLLFVLSLTVTVVELLEQETLSQLALELVSQLRLPMISVLWFTFDYYHIADIYFSCSVLWLRLGLSLSATRNLCFHLFYEFPSHRCTYLCLFVHSSESPSAAEFIVFPSLPRIMVHGVNMFNWMSSST